MKRVHDAAHLPPGRSILMGLARLGIKAMIVGGLAAFSAACVVAILTP